LNPITTTTELNLRLHPAVLPQKYKTYFNNPFSIRNLFEAVGDDSANKWFSKDMVMIYGAIRRVLDF
ncbi:hypothetical protein PILCRDRAFT_829852, partial [Piloderma croceum F 1598]